MARRTVTLREIARRTGVHESTVSRALNERTRHLVARDVAARIAATARELGYRPNVMAAALRTRRSMAVGLVVDDIGDPAHLPAIAAAEATLRAAGYALTLVATGGETDRLAAALDSLAGRGADGAILLDRTLPAAGPSAGPDDTPPLPLVTPADLADPGVAGIGLAVAHLVRHGHRAIGHLAAPADTAAGHARLAGFRAAMTEADLFATVIETCESLDIAAGRAAAEALLARRTTLTALVADDDRLALGALDAIAAAGRRCPQDVSVTGLGALPLTGRTTPPLTTVALDAAAVGRRAAAALLARLDVGMPEDVPAPPTVLLIARGSSGPAPTAGGPAKTSG